MPIEITPLGDFDLERVRVFADRWIGDNYFTLDELKDISKRSHGCSFVAFDTESNAILGIRLTFAPGHWPSELMKKATPSKWGVEENKVGYFKSLFIHEDAQEKGLGKKLSNLSIDALKGLGAKAIVCHSWLESPGNSSQKYLQSMGFTEVIEYPLFWHDVDYLCSGCKQDKCICTALEMIKEI